MITETQAERMVTHTMDQTGRDIRRAWITVMGDREYPETDTIALAILVMVVPPAAAWVRSRFKRRTALVAHIADRHGGFKLAASISRMSGAT